MAGRFFLIFYRLLWDLFSFIVPALLLWRAYKGKEDRARLNERYGISNISRPRHAARLYWLHGVSIGESVSSLVLGMAILEADPDGHILITSNTITSQHMLHDRINDLGLTDKFSLQTHPYDRSKWVKNFLNQWQPDIAVMMESEIWPNMVTLSHKQGIPVMMASAQISEKSLRRWNSFAQSLSGPVFESFSKIIAIDAEQSQRFGHFVHDEKIVIGGSMKAAAPRLPVKSDLVKQITDGADGRAIILLASSHDSEEALFIEAFEGINQSGAFMGIIAPRHIARGNMIESLIASTGMATCKHSAGAFPNQNTKIWVADTIGEMGSLIKAADLIVLGGSFAPLGGHNPMEMAALEKGVISGPHIFKNKAIFKLLEENQGCLFAENANTLADMLTVLAASTTQLQRLNHGAILSYKNLIDAADKTAHIVINGAKSHTSNTP